MTKLSVTLTIDIHIVPITKLQQRSLEVQVLKFWGSIHSSSRCGTPNIYHYMEANMPLCKQWQGSTLAWLTNRPQDMCCVPIWTPILQSTYTYTCSTITLMWHVIVLPCSQYVGVFFYYYYYYSYCFHCAPHTWQSSRKSDCLLEASTTMQRLGVDHPLVWNPCHPSQYVHSARSYHGLGIDQRIVLQFVRLTTGHAILAKGQQPMLNVISYSKANSIKIRTSL